MGSHEYYPGLTFRTIRPEVEVLNYNLFIPRRVFVSREGGGQRVLTGKDDDGGGVEDPTEAARGERANVNDGEDAEVEVVGTEVGRAGSFEDEATCRRQRWRMHARDHHALESQVPSMAMDRTGPEEPVTKNVATQQLGRL